MDAIEYPKSHSDHGDIPIAAMTRYCDVLATLVDVLPAPYPDAEEYLKRYKTEYRDNSI